MLDSLRAARPFLVQKPLPLAAVKVSPQIDQGVDHLLAALLELRQGDRRRGLSGEEGESPLLGRRVPVGAGHCEQAEGPSRRFQGLGAREAEGAGRRLGVLRNGEDALDLLGREPLDGVGRPGEDPLVLTVLLHDGDVSYRRPRQVEGDGQGGLGDLRYGLEPRELRRGARNLFEDVAVHRVQACRFHGVLPPLLHSATRLNTSLLPCVARRRNIYRVLVGTARAACVAKAKRLPLVASVEPPWKVGSRMATEAFDGSQVQRYSNRLRRSLIAMVSRRTLRRVN